MMLWFVVVGRQAADFYCRYVPGFENAYLLDTSSHIGLRSSRRIHGIETLTTEDVVKLKKYPDGIARGSFGVDVWPADSYTCKAGNTGGGGAFDLVGIPREEFERKINRPGIKFDF